MSRRRRRPVGVWVTELGSSDNSGASGAETFGSSLWYADALGAHAQMGHAVACRQARAGWHAHGTDTGTGMCTGMCTGMRTACMVHGTMCTGMRTARATKPRAHLLPTCCSPAGQALVGGRYALLARPLDAPRDAPLQPRPDFWVAPTPTRTFIRCVTLTFITYPNLYLSLP